MELILENVRCFAERQTIPVKPLTLLVGENSAGKSTFLACLSAVSDPYAFPLRPRFNERPYNLGNYDNIASYKYGRGIRAKSFAIGYQDKMTVYGELGYIIADYVDNKGQPSLAKVSYFYDNVGAEFNFPSDNKVSLRIEWQEDNNKQHFIVELPNELVEYTRVDLFDLLLTARNIVDFKFQQNRSEDLNNAQSVMSSLSQVFEQHAMPLTLSVAPIRTKPKRTYDEVIDEFSPEGDHMPFVLDDILQDANNRAILENFGRESGLFSKVAVKQWGKKRSDPLQVLVTNEGRPASSAANLVDVGYGVSQALPLVVQSLLAAPESRLLLQQPEVHLHPRAQAALGTLFVDLLATTKKQFVVETHSDYILDRVRQEVAKGRVSASDVGILYFEREKNGTKVHPIELDGRGNITNAPPSYRSFFLQEEYNLLTRAQKNGARK